MYRTYRRKATLFVATLAITLVGALFAGSTATTLASNRPATLLPGDAAVSTAAYNQNNPQIARGGSSYLVVWEDSRTNYINLIEGFAPGGGEESGQLLKDIYAIRIDANGQPIDQTPIVVSQDVRSQTKPQVAWNGENWLVAWSTERLAGTSTTIDVMAARVSAGGQLLDSPSIIIDSDPAINELSPVVSSDGTNWIVTWEDGWSDGRLDATRISPSGTVLDPAGVSVVIANFPDQPFNPGITFAGDEYLFVWQGNNRIRGQRVSTTLQPIGSVFEIGAGNFPRVATDGTDFLVTWKLAASVLEGRVTHVGQVLDGTGIDVSASHGGDPRPQAAWDGTQWFITWVATSGTAYASRVAANGSVTDPGGIAVAASARVSAIAPQQGGGVKLAWGSYLLNGLGSTDVFGGSMSASGAVGQASGLSVSAPQQLRPDIAANGTGYLTVFMSNVSGETRIKGQRLDSTGNAIDAEPFLIMGGSRMLDRPRVAWNGSIYLVVWEDNSVSRGFAPGAIFGKRISATGQVLDPSPVEIMGGNTPDVSALGATFLVVDTFEQTNHIRFPMAVRVDDTGTVLGSPSSIGQNYSVLPKVATLGSRWLAVWQRSPTHDNPSTFIYGSFINADGTGAGSFLVAGVNAGLNVKAPDVAAGPDQALISYFNTAPDYSDNGDIFARRIMVDGTLLDNDPGIQVTSAVRAQQLPSGAWTGSEYIVAYEDYRAVPFLERPVSDLYATRISNAGTVLDPDGIAIGNEAIPEVNAVVASNPGAYLIGFANFKYAAPYGAYRVDIRYGQAGAPPTPESTGTPTSTSTATVTVPTNTATATLPVPTNTGTVVATLSPTASATATSMATSMATGTSTSVATGTPATATDTPAATDTPSMPTATATTTACTIQFDDVLPGSTFYPYIECLACQGIITGYPDNTFRPSNPITRGQAAKIMANAAGFNETIPPTQQTFLDVPPDSTFWVYIERVAMHGAINGYPDGTYRPGNNMTRGQLSKIDSEVKGYNDVIPATQQTFTDVEPGSTFWLYIERVALHGIVSGYSDNTFRPNNDVTRGQASKIVTMTFSPECASPPAP